MPSPTTATPESHPDCRADRIQIVALRPGEARSTGLPSRAIAPGLAAYGDHQIRSEFSSSSRALRCGRVCGHCATLCFQISKNRADEISPRISDLIVGLFEDWLWLDERIETVTHEIEEISQNEANCELPPRDECSRRRSAHLDRGVGTARPSASSAGGVQARLNKYFATGGRGLLGHRPMARHETVETTLTYLHAHLEPNEAALAKLLWIEPAPVSSRWPDRPDRPGVLAAE